MGSVTKSLPKPDGGEGLYGGAACCIGVTSSRSSSLKGEKGNIWSSVEIDVESNDFWYLFIFSYKVYNNTVGIKTKRYWKMMCYIN